MTNIPTVFRTRQEKVLERIARVRAVHDAKVAALKRAKGDEIRANMTTYLIQRRAKQRTRTRWWKEDQARRMASVHAAARTAKVGSEVEALLAAWAKEHPTPTQE